MFANLTGFHLIIVLGVVVLLFGAAKLPLLAKNLGSSARILKTELRGIQDEKVPAEQPAAPIAQP